ncbi:MAG: electron transfer flavoprotein subunit alpha/FixB family protein [Dehalococcoidales bacterium]|nr:electron transfer flavoprotein subunit alpha/FixB family protein [Dehalococcoidales bacterium]
MADNKGILVFGEIAEDGKLSAIATELLGCGKKLSTDLGEELVAVIAGSGISGLAAEAVAFGADKVYVADDPLLKDYQSDTYLQVMSKLVAQVNPSVLILGQTAIGRDLAPRLAFNLKSAATLDCVELAIDPDSKKLLQTKPVYGGNARAIFTTDSFPQIATLRAKAAAPLARDDARKGEVIPFDAGLDASTVKVKVAEKIKEEVAGIKLEDAKVIIAGGRGIGTAEGFKQLDELAKLLKGAVGASRPPCDNKWIPDSAQIGLTGKIVTPDLYIAVAVSGSSQHMAGCSGSKTIIAINKDPEANIFREARFGVVGDWKKILPAFGDKVKELIAG